jgi:hypothetical protein
MNRAFLPLLAVAVLPGVLRAQTDSNALVGLGEARWQRYACRLGGQNAFDAEQKARWLAEADSPKWKAWKEERLRAFRQSVS